MEVIQMKYYPKEIWYETRGDNYYIVLNYGDYTAAHKIVIDTHTTGEFCTCEDVKMSAVIGGRHAVCGKVVVNHDK